MTDPNQLIVFFLNLIIEIYFSIKYLKNFQIVIYNFLYCINMQILQCDLHFLISLLHHRNVMSFHFTINKRNYYTFKYISIINL